MSGHGNVRHGNVRRRNYQSGKCLQSELLVREMFGNPFSHVLQHSAANALVHETGLFKLNLIETCLQTAVHMCSIKQLFLKVSQNL